MTSTTLIASDARLDLHDLEVLFVGDTRRVITVAQDEGLICECASSPVDDKGSPLSIEQAIEVAREDASLLSWRLPESAVNEHMSSDGHSVLDARGGRWWPSDVTTAVLEDIEPSRHPRLLLAICALHPMRGSWRD